MKGENYYRPALRLFDGRMRVLIALMVVAVLAAGYRFILGLGATTNLSDQFPWGLWVAFDVICGVALAAGGFTTAAVVYIFMEEKYHGLVRPAVLTALLGYVFVAVGLLVDLGKPWNIWHPIIYWPKHSALFEVAWCVMLYLSVLALEFAPAIFERLGWSKLHELWRLLVPPYVIFALTFFTYVMSHSIWWTLAAFVAVTAVAVFTPALVRSRPGTPIVLIIAGVIFSTAHQSSLGTLFLLMPDKLHPLWWTPLLPVNFFLSAVAVGFAMVIFEATISARSFGLAEEEDALTGLSRYLVYGLAIYLVVRVVDILARGQIMSLFSVLGLVFLAEMLVGVVLPLVILLKPGFRASKWMRFSAASLVVLGLVWNRFSTTLFAMHRPGTGWYFPSVEELVITTGIVCAIIFFYNIAVMLFPVLPAHEVEPSGSSAEGAEPSHHGQEAAV